MRGSRQRGRGGARPRQLILIGAIEYAFLGLAVAFISRKPWGRLPAYVLLGFGTRLVVGALVLALTIQSAAIPPAPLAMVSKGLNEVLFPLGCSIVLYSVNALGQRVRLAVAT